MRLADTQLEAFHELLEQMEMAGGGTPRRPAAGCGQGDLGTAGENVMRSWFGRRGWQVIPDTKQASEPGPDAIAWRKRKDGRVQVLLIDNKADDAGRRGACPPPATTGGRARAITEVPGLRDSSLKCHIGRYVYFLRSGSGRRRPWADEAAQLLELTWVALVRSSGIWTTLPQGVFRVATNGCGCATGVSGVLAARHVRFVDVAGVTGGRPLPPELS
jgi:hypothetical protein